jgi:hypothetical protein
MLQYLWDSIYIRAVSISLALYFIVGQVFFQSNALIAIAIYGWAAMLAFAINLATVKWGLAFIRAVLWPIWLIWQWPYAEQYDSKR